MSKMTAKAFVDKAVDIAKNYKTLYVMGCFGAPLTGSNTSSSVASNRPMRIFSSKEVLNRY